MLLWILRYKSLDSYGIMQLYSNVGRLCAWEVIHLEKQGIKVMARNREAYHEYFV